MAALPLTAKHRQRIWFLRASSQVSAETGSAPKIFPSYPALTLPCSRCTPSQRAKAPLWVDPDVSPCMGLHFHCCPQSLLHAQSLVWAPAWSLNVDFSPPQSHLGAFITMSWCLGHGVFLALGAWWKSWRSEEQQSQTNKAERGYVSGWKRGFMVLQTLWQLQQGFWVQKIQKILGTSRSLLLFSCQSQFLGSSQNLLVQESSLVWSSFTEQWTQNLETVKIQNKSQTAFPVFPTPL